MKLRIGLFCLVGGLCFTVSALGAGHFGWLLLSGAITAAALYPVVRFGPRNLPAQFGVILLALMVIGLICTLSEGALFYPEMRAQLVPSLMKGTLVYLLATAVMVGLGQWLKLTDPGERPVPHRSPVKAILMVLLASFSYLIYYEVFGGIAYQFFTKQYYPHAAEQAMALGIWFPIYQLARGIAMTLAVLPVIYTLRLPRWRAALAVGLLVWIVGGGAPLLVPNGVMVTAQRYIHIVEIFTQNFSLGMTAVWLLRPKTAKVAKSERPLTAA
jgi:hypothetical protein